MSMRVSIITAVRNAGHAIGQTIDSVNSQSYPHLEHIFVDGDSTDGTVEVIRTRSTRTKRLISERDGGVYDAFGKGAKLASGDIIVYLNAGDTYSDNDVVSRVVDRFSASRVEAIFGDVAIVDEKDPDRIIRHYRSSRFKPSLVAFGFMPAHPALFLRRGVYETFGHYDPSYRIAGDFELVARIFVRGRIRYESIDQVLVRMPRGGLSTSGPRSNWIITREMLRACKQNGIRTNLFKLGLRFPIKMLEFITPAR